MPLLLRISWIGGWLALLALAWWMQHLTPAPLAVAAGGALVWTAGAVREHARRMLFAALLLWGGIAASVVVQYQLLRIAREWPEIQRAVEERASDRLRTALDDLVDDGERAVVGASEAYLIRDSTQADPRLFSQLSALRGATDVSALAVYDRTGRPVAWAGELRGEMPLEVLGGARSYIFHEGPLFSYIYFVRAIEGGGHAVAAVLLEGDLALGEGVVPFAEWFSERHGILPRFSLPDRAQGEAIWDWSTDIPILSVSFQALTQQRWWDRVVHRGYMTVGLLWALAFVLLSAAWYRGRVGPPALPVAIGTLGFLLIPLGQIVGNQALFSPLQFVLPMPGDISLGLFLVLLVGIAIWVLIRVDKPLRWRRVPLWVPVSVTAILFPAAVLLMSRSAAAGLLAGRVGGGVPLQFATTLLLAVPIYLLFQLAAGRRTRRNQLAYVISGVLVSAVLGAMLLWWWNPARMVPVWAASLWAVPFALMATGIMRSRPRRSALPIWLLAAWLAGSATLPSLWLLHLDARLENAERELARLGTEADPFLDFLLRQFAERAEEFAFQGEEGVNLLYHSWVASGLAQEGYQAYLTTWSDGVPRAEIRLTDFVGQPASLSELVMEHADATAPVVQRFTSLESLHYLLVVPLPGERTIAVAVPPRRQLGRSTTLARFLQPATRAEESSPVDALFLVPAPTSAAPLLTPDSAVSWVSTAAGWRSEARVRFPSGWMHAHLLVRRSSTPILFIQAILILAGFMVAVTILWAAARALAGQLRASAKQIRRIRSFRGRLTLALFAFFLVPTAIFGAVTYGAVSKEVVRSAAVLARRTLEDAARTGRDSDQIGAFSDDDLLLYRRGTLVGATAREVLDLGLFHTWLPPEVYLQFSTAEDLQALEERQLGRNEYLVAYRRIDPVTVIGAPIPLASDEITRRQREFAHITALMILLGMGLSLGLSLFVGRALARPLDEMSRAAAMVGGGNLRLRLPEDRMDEFGSVYRSFNTMVSRLRRARAAEVRSARVLAWGEMARQVAHEIKNPLTPIKLSVQHLRRAYADRQPDFEAILHRNVDAILKEIDALGEISRAFSRFGSPADASEPLVPVDVVHVVEDTLALYRSGRAEVRFELETSLPVPNALARAGELKEVLINLFENARDALIGKGGAVRVFVEPLPDGTGVLIRVIDTGEGIAADLLSRVFEPHFSTRTSGTGLGLAIVRRLVESWGGEVTAISEEGKGTEMRILLQSA